MKLYDDLFILGLVLICASGYLGGILPQLFLHLLIGWLLFGMGRIVFCPDVARKCPRLLVGGRFANASRGGCFGDFAYLLRMREKIEVGKKKERRVMIIY